MAVNVVTGIVSNVVPIGAGSGYLTTPTITLTDSGVTQAVANVVGEDSSKGGNINARYISRRVTLEDGFDASDLKVILNAYKPLGTGVHVYYKVKSEDDPQDFDDKSYVLMSQETPSSVQSGTEDDVKEFVYKTADEKINYTSDEVDWLVLHQANQRILDSVGDRLKIPREKILSNLEKYGNTSAATIPLVMDEAIRNNSIKQNDIIATSGFGAGLSWGAALIKWG